MSTLVYIDVEETEPWPILPWWMRIVTGVIAAIIPKANPDFEHLYPKVKHWLLEVEVPAGLPKREVGLDIDGNAIASAPIGRNYGFWVDGPAPMEWEKYPKVEPSLFNQHWKTITDRLGTTSGPE